MQGPTENKESVMENVGEVAGEIAMEGVIDGAFEVAGSIGETVLGGVGDLLGGILDLN